MDYSPQEWFNCTAEPKTETIEYEVEAGLTQLGVSKAVYNKIIGYLTSKDAIEFFKWINKV